MRYTQSFRYILLYARPLCVLLVDVCLLSRLCVFCSGWSLYLWVKLSRKETLCEDLMVKYAKCELRVVARDKAVLCQHYFAGINNNMFIGPCV